jgi:hypothetical protein
MLASNRLRAWSLAVVAAMGCNAVLGIREGKRRDDGQSSPALECRAPEGKPSGALSWAKRSESIDCGATGVALGANGTVYVVGTFSEQFRFGNTVKVGKPNPDSADLFVAGLAQGDGAASWANAFVGQGQVEALDIAVDAKSGSFAVTGTFENELPFEEAGTLKSAAPNDYDIYLAYLDGGGVPKWAKRYGGTGDQRGMAVAIDPSGNIVIAASGVGVLSFGKKTLGQMDAQAVYLAKLDSEGNEIWSRWYPTNLRDEELGLAIDSHGGVLLVGGAGTPLENTTNQGGADVFALRFDASGNFTWGKMFGNGPVDLADQWALAATFDCAGDVILTGGFQAGLVLGQHKLTSVGAGDESDVFVAKLRGSDGEPIWAKAFGDAGKQFGNSVATDRYGNVVIAGHAADTSESKGLSFGGAKLPPSGSDSGSWEDDFWIAKLDASGAHSWSKRMSDRRIQRGKVALLSDGTVFAAGMFHTSIVFDGSANGSLSSSELDFFVARFAP